jgi:hypothetical protein
VKHPTDSAGQQFVDAHSFAIQAEKRRIAAVLEPDDLPP